MSRFHYPRVAVIGGARPRPRELAWAEAVGRELGARGVVVVTGGRGGVMEAACRGAKEAGGFTIGILPGLDPEEANAFVDVPIVTGLGEARNLLVVRNAQAVVAVGGSYGTLSELAFALKLERPVVGLGTWDLDREGLEVALVTAQSPEEAVTWVMERLTSSRDIIEKRLNQE